MKRISMYMLLLCASLSISKISFAMDFFKGAASFLQNLDKGLDTLEEKRGNLKKYLKTINKVIDIEEAQKVLDSYDEKNGLSFDDLKKIVSCIRTKPIIYMLKNQLKAKVALILIKQFDLTGQELSNIKLELLPQCFDFKTSTFHFEIFKDAIGVNNLNKIAKQSLNKLCKIYNIPQENIKKIIDHDTLLTVFLNTGKLNTKMLKACVDNDAAFYQLLRAFSLQNAMDISVLEKSVDIEVLKFDKNKIIESIKTKDFAQWLLSSLKLEGKAPLAITQEVVDSAKYLLTPQKRQEEDPKVLYLEQANEEEKIKNNIFSLGMIQGAKYTSYATLAAYGAYSLFVNPFFYWTVPVAYGSHRLINYLAQRGNKYLMGEIETSTSKLKEVNEVLTAKNRLEYWLFKFAESILISLFDETIATDDEVNLKKTMDASDKKSAAAADPSLSKESAASSASKKAKSAAAGATFGAANASFNCPKCSFSFSVNNSEPEGAANSDPESVAKRKKAREVAKAAAAAASAAASVAGAATVEDDDAELSE